MPDETFFPDDPLYPEAKETALKIGFVSVSQLQRHMRIGFTRAARLIDRMVAEQFCGPCDASGRRYIFELEFKNKHRMKARLRLEQVKAYILRYWRLHCISPTTHEIACRFRTSTSVVSTWLTKLESEGWMVQRPPKEGSGRGKARQIVPALVKQALLAAIQETNPKVEPNS
jgi:hypothetical protein